MIAQLPDVAQNKIPHQQAKLNWVGMDDIYLPICFEEAGSVSHSQACASIAVDLPGGENAAKGIHMSRLYFLLNTLTQAPIKPEQLKHCLEQALASHSDLGASVVRIELAFDFIWQRPALVSPSPAGWRAYPMVLTAQLSQTSGFHLSLQTEFQYSSTCPCSAALVRETLANQFRLSFANQDSVSPQQVSQWLKQNGTFATPHSQRSLALITLPLDQNENALHLVDLIEEVEGIIATPVQTSVKRADELAFAELNGANLIFVEDISRKLGKVLKQKYDDIEVQVRHLESLHAHNAFAQISSESTLQGLKPQFKQGPK